MENHPIPQDVTGFQFKLIGNMTIKQFAYIVAGAIVAVIGYYAPAQGILLIVIKYTFILLSILSGVALAFLPIEGRPADAMVAHFFKALFTPNQYIYQKLGGHLTLFDASTTPSIPSLPLAKKSPKKKEEKSKKLEMYLQAIHNQQKTSFDEKEESYLSSLTTLAASPMPQQNTMPDGDGEKPQTAQLLRTQEQDVNEKVTEATEELARAEKEEKNAPSEQKAQSAHDTVLALQKQLNAFLAQKKHLEEELEKLQQALRGHEALKPQVPTPLIEIPPATTQALSPQPILRATNPSVRKIPYDLAKGMGLPNLPQVPNLIIGIVKDSRGNVLPNILIEVEDQDGSPARAFRTNALGQFASATPLANGDYLLELEDPAKTHQFDVIEIHATGAVIPPLEIISHDAREELRRALFN